MMNGHPDFRHKVVRLWKRVQLALSVVAVFSPVLMLDVITGANENGMDAPWALIATVPLVLIGMIAFAGEVVRRMFNFMVGARACKWWWQS